MISVRLKICVSFLFIAIGINAQQTNFQSLAKNLLLEKQTEWKLESEDIAEFDLTDRYTSKHNGVTHIFVKQNYKGIAVFNAISNFNIKDGKLLLANNNFISKLKSKVKSQQAKLSAEDALILLADDRGIVYNELPALTKKSSDAKYLFKQASFTKSEIPVELVYFEDKTGAIQLAWNIELQMNTSPDFWNSLVDANTGEVLKTYNQTLYCKFADDAFGRTHQCNDHSHNHVNQFVSPNAESSVADGSRYRVYPFPVESPIHGEQALVEDPAFRFASPFGWHDTDGLEGPEFTITRGNNVWAYEDSQDEDESQGNEPNGGPDLNFDFPLDLSLEPDTLRESVITNLFYASNYTHDWAYYYGFDEQAGNFQTNNYANGGRDNDEVQANGLDGEDIGNANFSLVRDGSQPFLQMYKWTGAAGSSFLNIDAPATIEGPLETGDCLFCPGVSTTPVTGRVVIIDDLTGNGGDGCEAIANADEVRDNIALIDRGSCNFTDKVFNAQEAGAIAVIICNFEEGLVSMSAPENENRDFLIPALFLERRDCDAIRSSMALGEEVVITFQAISPENEGPSQLSGSYDNGIIAHEYGHGISSRLTGGPNSICLFNDEEMGEGWSDFVALVLTHQPDDEGEDIRGIGNYVTTGNPDGRGIRRLPYTTDFSLNSHTYNSIRSSRLIPHNLGEVWATILWDMYWTFIDVYGYNPDWTDQESGNYKAVQLVFDGMKFQGCSPGFVRGRNGILAADEALFNGEHQCLLWEVFAKRGLGFFADEGSTNDRNDNTESFDLLPTCVEQVKITKEMTEVVDAGNDISVDIIVTNHKKDAVTGTTVTDIIPEGSSYKQGSANVDFELSGNSIVFDLGTMQSLAEREIKYELETDVESSNSMLFDDFEDLSSILTPFPIRTPDGIGVNVEWRLTDIDAFRGEQAYFIPNLADELQQGLVTIQPFTISGNRPTLSFRHMYDTEFYFDGGVVEISTDNGNTFQYLPNDLFLKGQYDTEIDFRTFAIPEAIGFTGDSDGWVKSYVDLSDFKGEDVLIRFRFGCDENPTDGDDTAKQNPIPRENTGWYLDNFEIVDLSYIDGNNAMVTTNEGDEAEAGDITVINSEFTTPTQEIIDEHNFLVYPNPASDIVYVNFKSEKVGDGSIQLFDTNGRLLKSKSIAIKSVNSEQLNIAEIPSGVYFIKLTTDDISLSSKIVIENY